MAMVLLAALLSGLSVPPLAAQERVPEEATLSGEFAGAGTVDATGAFVYSVPIEAPATSAGIAPSLSLEYSSRGGVSMLGRGWSLGGLSLITRCSPQKGEVIANGDPLADRAFCLDGQRLKLKDPSADQHEYGESGTVYGVERDNAVEVVANGTCGYGPCGFYVFLADGGMMGYGDGTGGEVYPYLEAELPAGDAETFDVETFKETALAWSVNAITDRHNNRIWIDYHAHRGALYPAKIRYGYNLGGGAPSYSHGVEFVYNVDFASGVFARHYSHIDRRYRNGGVIDASGILLEEIRTYVDLAGEDFVGARRVSSHGLYYDDGEGDGNAARQTARLEQIQLCVEGGGGVAGGCLEPLAFTWEGGEEDWEYESVPVAMPMVRAALGGEFSDWNGLINMVSFATLLAIPLDATPVGWIVDIAAGIIDLAVFVASWFDFDEQTYGGVLEVGEWVDIDGDGIADYVGDAGAGGGEGTIWFGQAAGGWVPDTHTVPARYGRFPAVTAHHNPGHDLSSNPFTRPEDRFLVDVDGDGRVDLVHREGATAGSVAPWSDEEYLQYESGRWVDGRPYYMKSRRGTWRIALGDGRGGFAPAGELPGPLDSHDLVPMGERGEYPMLVGVKQPLGALVDVNGDGRLDYVRGYCDVLRDAKTRLLTGQDVDSCAIYLQDGAGTFVSSPYGLPYPLWGRTRFTAQVNAAGDVTDGLDEESALARHGWEEIDQHEDDVDFDITHYLPHFSFVFQGYGGDDLTAPWVASAVRSVQPTLLGQLIDLNGDGYPDYVKRECAIGSETCVWLGTGNEDGEGFFEAAPHYRLALSSQVDGATRALFMDVNGDRYPDQVEAGDCGWQSALAEEVEPAGTEPGHGWCHVYHGSGRGFVEAGRISRDPLGEEILFQDFNDDGYLDYHKRGGCHTGTSTGGEFQACTFLGTGATGAELFVRDDAFTTPVEDFDSHFVQLDLVPGLGSLPLLDSLVNTRTYSDYQLGNFLDLNADGAIDYLVSVCQSDAEPVGSQGISGTFERTCAPGANDGLYTSRIRPVRIVGITSRRGNHQVHIDYQPLRDGNGVYRRSVDPATLPEGVGVVTVGAEVVAEITTEVRTQGLDTDYAHQGSHGESYRYENLLYARYNGLLGFEKRWHWSSNNGFGSLVQTEPLAQPLERTLDWGAALGVEPYSDYPLAGLSQTEVSFRTVPCSELWPACLRFEDQTFAATGSRESVYEVADDEQAANEDFHRVRIIHSASYRHGDAGQRVAGTGVSFAYDDHGYPVVVVDHGDLDESGDETTVYAPKHHDDLLGGQFGLRLGMALGSRTYLGQAFGLRSSGDGVSAMMPDFIADPAAIHDGMTLAAAESIRYGDSGTDIHAQTTWAGVWDGERWLQSQATEDGFGRVVSATDAVGVTRTTGYRRETVDIAGTSVDSDVIEHVVTGANGEDGGTVSSHYDRASGALVRSVDANGGVYDTAVDALGRPSESFVPSPWIGSAATIGPFTTAATFWDFEVGDYTTEVRTTLGYADQIRSHHIARSYADALGRTYLSRATTVDVDSEFAINEPDDYIGLPPERDWIEQRTEYAANGLESRTSDPYRRGSGASVLWTETLADAYGETRRVMAPSGAIHDIVRDRNHPEPSVRQTIGEYGTVLGESGGGGFGGTGDAAITLAETVYDRQGRVKSHRANPQSVATEYHYDRINRTVTTRDSAGVERIHQVDLLGRPLGSLGDGGLRSGQYNALGQLEQSTQYRDIGTPDDDLTTTYTYDGLGRLTEVRDEPGTADPGRLTRYVYDGLDPDTGEADPDNPHALGRLTTVIHPGGERDTRLYDRLGRVVETRRHIPALAETFVSRTAYDLTGTVHAHTYPDGYQVSYDYDEHHRLAAVRGHEAGEDAQLLLHSPTYDPLERLTAATLGDGTRVSYHYDAYGRPTRTVYENGAGEVLFDETLAYNGIDQIVGTDETLAGIDPHYANVPPEARPVQTRGLTYDYDDFNRLTGACVSSTPAAGGSGPCQGDLEAHHYTYNASGALATMDFTRDGAPWRQKEWLYDADAPHRLETLVVRGEAGHAFRVLDYRYDRNGNVQEVLREGNSQRHLTFDRHNRLLKVTTPGTGPGTTRDSLFSYDHDLQRISRTDADGTTTFYISGNYELTRTANGVHQRTRYIGAGGALKMSFSDVTGEDASTAFIHPGAGYPSRGYGYFFTDQRGSTRVVTDRHGRVRARLSTGPYGTPYQLQGQNNFRPGFIGQERDQKTGLDYFNARYYDADAHQFISTDPAGEFDNPYLYSPANPIGFSDPSGRYPIGKLIRKLSAAAEEERVTVIVGLTTGSHVSENDLQMAKFTLYQNGFNRLKFLDLREAQEGVYRSASATSGGYATTTHRSLAAAMRAAGLDEQATDRTLILMEHDPGDREIRLFEGSNKYSIKELYENLIGGDDSFNRAVKCVIDIGCKQGSTAYAQQLANRLGRKVFASPFNVSTPYARLRSTTLSKAYARELMTDPETTVPDMQEISRRLGLYYAFFDTDGVSESHVLYGSTMLANVNLIRNGKPLRALIATRYLHTLQSIREGGEGLLERKFYTNPPFEDVTLDFLEGIFMTRMPAGAEIYLGNLQFEGSWGQLWDKFSPQ